MHYFIVEQGFIKTNRRWNDGSHWCNDKLPSMQHCITLNTLRIKMLPFGQQYHFSSLPIIFIHKMNTLLHCALLSISCSTGWRHRGHANEMSEGFSACLRPVFHTAGVPGSILALFGLGGLLCLPAWQINLSLVPSDEGENRIGSVWAVHVKDP